MLADNQVDDFRFIDQLGLQVFSVRDRLKNDPVAVFKELSEIGIQSIELFDPATLSEYAPLIKDVGMTVNCCHFLPGYITGNWDTARQIGMAPPDGYELEQVLEDCNKHGIKYLGVAIMMPEDRQVFSDYSRFADQMNKVGEQCKKAGVQLYYHNHSFEFKPEGNTTPMDAMLKIFDKDLVKIEMDPFWVSISGNDPLALMDRLGDQLSFIHLKDLKKGTPTDYTVFEVEETSFVELGKGILDFEALLTKARSMGVQNAFIDQDHSQLEMMMSIRSNYQFVKNLKI